MLIQTPELNLEQLAALDCLSGECKQTDGNLPAIYRHLLEKHRGRPSSILCYAPPMPRDIKKLIGFLGAFFFHEKTCEIAIMVAPPFRRKGIAAQMLKALLPLLKSEYVDTVTFSSPHNLNDTWFSIMGMQYQGSEFQMQRAHHDVVNIHDTSAHIRSATQADIPFLCAIDIACFADQKTDMPAHIQGLLNDPSITLFILEQNNIPIGKAHMNWQPDGVRLTDIAVLPALQGRGLGTSLVSHCINHALSNNKPDIRLDVETGNKKALGLYTRLGFTMINAHDYWNISELGLTAFLSHL